MSLGPDNLRAVLLSASTVDGLDTVGLRTDDIIIEIIAGDIPAITIAVGELRHRGLFLLNVVKPRACQGFHLTVDLYIELIGEFLGQDIVAVDVSGS